jgi:hypothetical protein
MTLLEKIISPKNFDNAFKILCKQRKDYSAHADIWDLRYNSTLRERSSKF